MRQKYYYLIVGSGLFGATFAYLARQAGKSCLVIDKRSHIGGNVYCENIEGINVHKYGPHIFHTKSREVWNFVNQFVDFNRFTLNTIVNFRGELYNLPFNMNTFHQMWGVNTPVEAMEIIRNQRFNGEVTNLEEQAISLVGKDIFEKLVKGYTEKQWGRDCKDLPSFIIRRLPVRLTYDNNYFNDPYQGIPIGGYNKLIDSLLEGCEVRTGCDFFESGLSKEWRNVANQLVYTGKIDDFYDCCFGTLEYRSLRFETEILDMPNYQGVALMNFTDRETPFTRIIEHKHFEMFGDEVYARSKTVITREYPMAYIPNQGEPYYPVNDERNSIIYAKYQKMASSEKNVIFGGRLADYTYYNMDQVIERAMLVFRLFQVKKKDELRCSSSFFICMFYFYSAAFRPFSMASLAYLLSGSNFKSFSQYGLARLKSCLS